MKIDGIDPLKGPGSNASDPKPAPGAPSFDELLKKEIVQGVPRELTIKTSGGSPVHGSTFLVPPVAGAGDHIDHETVAQVETTLTDLEMFKVSLGNNDIPVERLTPFVHELVAHKNEFISKINSVTDPKLKTILTDTLNIITSIADQHRAGYSA